MSVSPVNSATVSSLQVADPISAIGPLPSSSNLPLPDSDATSSATDAAASSVSSKAKLLHRLKGLAKSDPAEFKKVTADIASQLQAAGQQASGSTGDAFSTLAAKFQQASQTGSVSALLPGKRHHGGHRGVVSTASAAYAQTSSPATSGAGAQSDAIISSALRQATTPGDATVGSLIGPPVKPAQ